MTHKVTKEEYLRQQADYWEDHVQYHPANAFCGSAGAEEQKHVESLVDTLSDEEIAQLVIQNGITSDKESERSFYEGVIDEIDREDFYRTYGILILARK
jgi:hypothetical protein